MTGAASNPGKLAARISAQANSRAVGVKARSAGRSQNPRNIEAKLQAYLF